MFSFSLFSKVFCGSALARLIKYKLLLMSLQEEPVSKLHLYYHIGQQFPVASSKFAPPCSDPTPPCYLLSTVPVSEHKGNLGVLADGEQ